MTALPPRLDARDLRRVVIAAAVGNIIEWYDFYVFGSLTAILAVKFFERSHPVAALLSTIALFTIGFLIRPLGALVFGRIGDLVGRKYTFLVTLTGMGLSTALIGVVPTYATIGVSAAIILFLLRLVQGLCLGGEYGGAITYVAEHVSDEKRGFYTGWLQTSPTLGIVVSLGVVIGTRTALGTEAFNDWGWRIPFIASLLLVAVAIYIRWRLQETPIFQDIKAKGQTAANPWREAFTGPNLKYVAIATVVVLGEGCVWYSSQFWALFFLQNVNKLDVLNSSIIVGAALLIATPTLVLCGWLSDRIGRKPIILTGFLLAAVTYYPLYAALGQVAQVGAVNYPLAIAIVAVLVSYVGMVYGPIAAFLAEYFPSRIRYTSVSVPYHIGNGWGGGLVPFITNAVWAGTHNLGWTLAYSIAVPAAAFLFALYWMPETRHMKIWSTATASAGSP
ncbi:MAG TPA: MFS transporter [Gemmatimonadales bacterium]|jgi:MFS family permease|nr:MFS transporter [Gemmatimonadales bacterium]